MKKKVIWSTGILIALFVTWILFFRSGKNSDEKYLTSAVTRGDIETTITTTGTLKPIGTVDVGTQVSGRIDKILADFNDEVREDQVLAVLDTTTLSLSVKTAEARVQLANADYEKAEYEYERNKDLFKDNLISELEFITSKTSLSSKEASLTTAQLSYETAVRDMGYAIIKSPIDGKILYRNIEEGQTVAASLSTPTLFTITKDLTKMEIYASVDETDIGLIKQGQTIRFTVQAYQDEAFTGTVRQIWLEPVTVSNVVNYTVVINAENPDLLLLPGMTATIDFIIDARTDVLLIPNAALKIQPTENMLAAMHKKHEERLSAIPDSLKDRRGRPGRPGMGNFPNRNAGISGFRHRPQSGKESDSNLIKLTRIWYMDENSEIQSTIVKTGLSNTKYTELVFGPDITENMELITTIISGNIKSEESSGNSRPAFGGGGPGSGPGGRPPF